MKAMKNIYIFDEYLSSQKNGIGIYLQELVYCFCSLKYNICLIVFNAKTEEFKIIKEKKIRKILFPVLKIHFVYYVDVIEKFLRLYIEDSLENVFLINHTPCDDLMESLKTYFPLSKIVFTIHDFYWTVSLMGNIDEYEKVIKNAYMVKNVNMRSNMDYILKMYKKEMRMYELADRIICLSNDTLSILQNIYKINKRKIYCISSGLRDTKKKDLLNEKDKDTKRKKLYLRNEDKVLLFIGRPTKQKGIFELLSAMHIVLREYPNVKLVIIGDGDEVSIKEIINASSQIASSIIITGRLNRKDVKEWLTIADIGIIPSYYEQCSYVAIEMMMYGLPIITSNGLGLRNIFIDGVNAKVARIESKRQLYQINLARNIINLLDHPELCKNLSKEAKRTYKTKFAIKYMKACYMKLIDSMYRV